MRDPSGRCSKKFWGVFRSRIVISHYFASQLPSTFGNLLLGCSRFLMNLSSAPFSLFVHSTNSKAILVDRSRRHRDEPKFVQTNGKCQGVFISPITNSRLVDFSKTSSISSIPLILVNTQALRGKSRENRA